MNYLNSILKNLKTKSTIAVSAVVIGASGLGLAIPLAAHAAGCAPTGFYKDGINLTAAAGYINPTSPVTGTVSATGCNIGVFYGPGTHGTVNNATITGSNYYGVVVQQANVNVENSNVNTIGETPLNGDQHGVGIYYATVTSGTATAQPACATTGSTRGTINNNSVSTYQKAGIVANCTGTNVNIENNVVQGQGPVDYIAQNGIEIGVGANAVVNNNLVTDNSYTGAGGASSGGILAYGGAEYGGAYTTNTQITNNIVIGNDVGIWLSNISACGATTCTAATSRTNIDVTGNTIANAGLNNTTGNSATQGYQAGISDQGDGDTIVGNTITGAGYNPASSGPSISTTWIDVSSTNNVKLHNHNDFGYGSGKYF
jgi:hypothetical protein